MKIGLSVDISRGQKSGRGKFIRRLAGAIEAQGHTITRDRPDVYLYLPTHRPHPQARFNVLRLDGLYLNTKPADKKENRKMLRAARMADAVVFQNDYCRQAYERFLHLRPAVFDQILNGADPGEFLPRQPKNYLLANANWRPTKRLPAIIAGYRAALDAGLDADLYITGQPENIHEHPRIRYLGWQDDEQLNQLLAGAIASVHLTWIDWCPNAMIEALVAGCPVIYSASGGHCAVAGPDDGFAVPDEPWDFRPTDHKRPPAIDTAAVAQAMLRAARQPASVHRPDLFIDQIAQRYLAFFQSVVDSAPRGRSQAWPLRAINRLRPVENDSPAFVG